MTTVVADARAGLMVSDSRMTDGNVWCPVRKIERIDGRLIGWAGEARPIRAAREWWRGGKVGKPPAGLVVLLILGPEGISTWSPEDGEQPCEQAYWAIGSGAPCALTALVLGHDAVAAVAAAIQVDAQSGGAVQVERL